VLSLMQAFQFAVVHGTVLGGSPVTMAWHGMACPQVVDEGESLQIWKVAANILKKQSRKANKGWSSSLGVGRGPNNASL
jgi:hypothetical protein